MNPAQVIAVLILAECVEVLSSLPAVLGTGCLHGRILPADNGKAGEFLYGGIHHDPIDGAFTRAKLGETQGVGGADDSGPDAIDAPGTARDPVGGGCRFALLEMGHLESGDTKTIHVIFESQMP